MKGRIVLFAVCLIAASAGAGARFSTVAAQANTGTIKGRVRLSGKPPGNTIIRMGVDPMCNKVNAGKRVVQETVVASADGGLSNAFVKLQGTFPQTPVPADPVLIDQRGCIYLPRVVGMRVGQTLQVRNSDSFLHNVHSSSAHNNTFNVGQPTAGLVYQFRPKEEEIMLQLKCEVHRWMIAYVGIVSHPYFAVSGDGGAFEIDRVPAGARTVQAWHERYGMLTQTVNVKAGATTNVEFTYTGAEKPSATLEQLELPAGVTTVQLVPGNPDFEETLE
jgi:hypothetical protein